MPTKRLFWQHMRAGFTMRLSFRRLTTLTCFLLAAACNCMSEEAFAQDLTTEGDEYIARCIKILNYGSEYELLGASKKDAVLALGLYGDEKAVPALIEHFQNEESNDLRFAIIKSLGWIGSKSSIPTLEAALKDKYVFTRKAASWALKKITGKTYAYDATGEDAGTIKIPETPAYPL